MKRLFFTVLLLLWWGDGWSAQPAQTPGEHQPLLAPDGSTADAPVSFDLPKGKDLLGWEVLGQVGLIHPKQEKPPKSKIRMEITTPEGWERPKPRFTGEIKALDGQTLKMAGFMFPLDVSKEGQKRFLLAKMPPTCAFCLPGGPESMVLVEAAKPVRFTMDAIIVKGRFSVLEHDKDGMFYKLSVAHQEK
ncbi:putative DUF3299 domain-containing protein [uncultured Gammaproteobacteria bacterium]